MARTYPPETTPCASEQGPSMAEEGAEHIREVTGMRYGVFAERLKGRLVR
jgi:hypothetical protein